jgi:hypothetical protein
MKVDMCFCLVAQPWTYKKIGGPSKMPKDFPWPIPNHSGPWALAVTLYYINLRQITFHFIIYYYKNVFF